MKILSKDLVEEYYLSIKGNYPDLTLEECKEILHSPFKMTKESFISNKIETVRLKFLGTFLVYPKRAKAMLTKLTEKFNRHEVDKKEYFETKKMIDDFLSKES